MTDIYELIRLLEERINALPAGYISKKNINGKTRYYLQWRETSQVNYPLEEYYNRKKNTNHLKHSTPASLFLHPQSSSQSQPFPSDKPASLPHLPRNLGFENVPLHRPEK